VLERGIMNECKTCSKCGQTKLVKDFYISNGLYRPACKKCTIQQNGEYQKRMKPWRLKVSGLDRAEYMQEYRAKNKEKFALYRKTFLKKHPNYYKKYLEQKSR
jgi:transposase-like protein